METKMTTAAAAAAVLDETKQPHQDFTNTHFMTACKKCDSFYLCCRHKYLNKTFTCNTCGTAFVAVEVDSSPQWVNRGCTTCCRRCNIAYNGARKARFMSTPRRPSCSCHAERISLAKKIYVDNSD